MPPLLRNRYISVIAIVFITLCFLYLYSSYPTSTKSRSHLKQQSNHGNSVRPDENYFWAQLPERYPVQSLIPIPAPVPHSIPPIQYRFPKEDSSALHSREVRLHAVKENFTHAWTGYKKYAWMRDEVTPISGRGHDPFGGWAATLVDTLGEQHPELFIIKNFPIEAV